MGIERVLDIDERHHTAAALGFREHVLAERGLARGLGAEDLGDPAARDATHAEREVERDGAGRDGVHLLSLGRTEPHDGTPTELLLDGQDGRVDRLATLACCSIRAAIRGGGAPRPVDGGAGDAHGWYSLQAVTEAPPTDGLWLLLALVLLRTRLPLGLDELHGLRW